MQDARLAKGVLRWRYAEKNEKTLRDRDRSSKKRQERKKVREMKGWGGVSEGKITAGRFNSSSQGRETK